MRGTGHEDAHKKVTKGDIKYVPFVNMDSESLEGKDGWGDNVGCFLQQKAHKRIP
jgi:hypothetical protein